MDKSLDQIIKEKKVADKAKAVKVVTKKGAKPTVKVAAKKGAPGKAIKAGAKKGQATAVKVKGKGSVKKGAGGGGGAAKQAVKAKPAFKVGGGGAKKGVTVRGLVNKAKPATPQAFVGGGRGRGGRAVRGGRGGGGRGAGRGAVMVMKAQAPAGKAQKKLVSVAAGWTHDLFAAPSAKQSKMKKKGGAKIITKQESFNNKSGPITTGTAVRVSNLKGTVTAADMKELFETIGKLKNFPKLSNGTCTAVFVVRGDAVKAVQKYNGVQLDGKAMKMVLDKSHGIKKPVQFTVKLQ